MATGEYTISEDIRSSLPPDALEVLDYYDSQYGVGNEVSFEVAQSYLTAPVYSTATDEEEVTPLSRRRPPISEARIGRTEAQSIKSLANDLQINEGMSPLEAREEASRRIASLREKKRSGTTVEGQAVSSSSEQDILEAKSAWTAFTKSLGPQKVKVGRQDRLDNLGIPNEEIMRLRKQVVTQSLVDAKGMAKEQGLDFSITPEAFTNFVNEKKAPLMAQRLRELHSDWYNKMKSAVLKDRGLTSEEDLSKEDKKKIESEAQSRADAIYNYIVPLVFEDLGDVKVDGVSLVPSMKSGAIRKMHDRYRNTDNWWDASVKDIAGGFFYSNWHDYDPDTREVSETWLSAAVRDVGLIPRAVYYPIVRATTWDRNPETGDPYDKNDPMYKLSEWQDKQLAEGDLLGKAGAFLSGSFLGHGYNLDTNMNTGSILRDFALSHARGEMLHSDFGNLEATRIAQNAGVLPHYWDELWGIGLEVVVPLQTAKLPFSATRKVTQGTARATRSIAEAAKFDTVADVAEAIRASASTTDSLTDALVLRQFRRQAYKDYGLDVPPKSPLKLAVEAPDVFIDKMAADLSKKLMTTGDDFSSLKKVFPEITETNPLAVALQTGWSGLRDLRSLQKLDGKKFIKKVNDLKKTKSGKRLLAEIDASVALSFKDPSIPHDVLALNIVQGLVKNDVRKLVANHIPNNFVFAAKNLIVRRGTWLANQDKITKAFGKVIKGKHIKKDGEAFFKFENPKEVADAALRGYSNTELAPSVRKLIEDVKTTGMVPQKHYLQLTDLAKETVVMENLSTVKGAFAVQDPMDLAASRAAGSSTMRALTVARYAEDIAKGTRALFRGDSDYRFVVSTTGQKRKRDIFRPTPKAFKADSPQWLKDWNVETVNELNNAVRQAENMIREANRGFEEGTQLSMAVKGGSKDLHPIRETGIRGVDDAQLESKLESLATGKALCEWLAKNVDDVSYAAILNRIKPFLDDVEVRIMKKGVYGPGPIANGSARGMAILPGSASPDSHLRAVVWIRSSDLGPRWSGMNAETIVHELLHAATMRRMGDARKVVNKGTQLTDAYLGLRAVARHVDKEWDRLHASGIKREDLPGNYYAIDSIDELVAWGLTNKEFQDFLKTIKVDSGESLFSRFVSSLRRLLNIPAGQENALSEIIRLTDNLLSSDLSGLKYRQKTSAWALSKVKPSRRSPDQAMNSVLQRVSGEDSILAYQNLLNIFFRPGKVSLTDWFTNNDDLHNLLKKIDLPKDANGKVVVTVDGFRTAITAVREEIRLVKGSEGLALLDNSALKTQRFAGIGITKTDDITAAMAAYVTLRIADDVYDTATAKLIENYPSIVMTVPSSADKQARLEMFKLLALENGVDFEVVESISSNVGRALDTNKAHRQSIANAVVRHLYTHGDLATLDDLNRIYDAAKGSIAGVVGKSATNLQAYDPSIEGIRNIIKSTNPDEVEDIMRLVVPAYLQAVANVDMVTVRAHFEAIGVRSYQSGVPGKLQKAPGLGSLGPQKFGDGMVWFDSRLAEVARGLGDSMKRNQILEQVERLRPSERKAFAFIGEALSTTRKTTITGILGGFPLPNSRFLGTNALTNPFITAITAPEYALTVALKTPSAVASSFVRAFRRAGLVPADKAYDPVKMLYTADDTAVMFTAADGVVWTKGMFEEAVAKQNVRFSQVSFEFGFDSYQDVMRQIKLGPDGKDISKMSRFVDKSAPGSFQWGEFLRPDKRNVWTMVAEEMDNLQREAVFAEALKRGLREKDAAALARSSLLDYGSIPPWFRQHFAKNMAFVGFRYNMMVETMKAFVRDGRALNNMARQMNFINVQRESMEEWVLQPDWLKTRFWTMGGKKFREYHAKAVGPGIPFADSFSSLINTGSMVFDSKLRSSVGIGGMVEKLGEGILSDPRIQQLFDLGSLKGDSSAPDGYMPIEYIAAFDALGASDLLFGMFDLKRVAPDKMRPDIGTYKGSQYQFADSSSNQLFKAFQLGLLVTGVNRNMRDYPRMLASVGVEPDDIDFAKGAEGGPMFWLGGSVASYKDARALTDSLARQYARELEEGMRKTSY